MKVRLKTVAHLVTDISEFGPLPFVALDSVESETGRLLRGTELPEIEAPNSGAAAVEPGDVLFGKLRPYLAKTWLADRRVYASTELMCLRPSQAVQPRWLGYLARSQPFIEWAVATSEGTKMPRTSWETLGQLPVYVPLVAAQRPVTDYLDRETARIDALIAAKQRMVKLLRERFIRTLDSALWGQDVPRIALRRIARFVDYRGATPTKQDHGVPLVTASHVRDGLIDLSVAPQFIGQASHVEWMRRGFPAIGDVLMTTEAPMGQVAQINDPGVALAQRLILLKSLPTSVLSDFLALALRSLHFQAQLEANATGSTALGIKADRLKALHVPVPTLDQQAKLVAHIRLLDEIRAQGSRALLRQVALLNEHRQALITAAVTGQLDIPEAAA